jgi:hypothetical protein
MEQEIAGVDEQASFTFQPKDGGPPMVARLTVNPSGSGWDFIVKHAGRGAIVRALYEKES